MCMIEKLSKDWKVDWPKHLPELVHAYNSMRLAITGYSLHYIMFRHWPCLPIDFYFPTVRDTQKYQHADHYIAELYGGMWEAFKRPKCSPCQRQRNRSSTMIGKLMPLHLILGDLVLAKVNTYREEEKVEGSVGGGAIWCGAPSCRSHPFLPHDNPKDQILMSPSPNWLFLIVPTERTHLCMVGQAKQARCTTTTLEEQTQKSETEEVLQSANCLLLAEHQAGETALGWVNRRLHAFIQMFSRASWIDKGRKVQCRGIRGV